MDRGFTCFAIIAGMRTGSNLLEEILAGHPDLSCHGELFNPHFVGQPDQDVALGVTRAVREAQPSRMLDAVRAVPGRLAGFRIFDGHDPRALAIILADPACAKIVLTRNPMESYVSLQIARQTRQWWMGDFRTAKAARTEFRAEDFGRFLDQLTAFRDGVRRGLLVAGQTSFNLRYEDLNDEEVLAGLFRFLGVDPAARKARTASRVQNPGPLEAKVTNPEALRSIRSGADPFALEDIPEFEPLRGAGVPGFRVAKDARLMFMPLGGLAAGDVDAALSRYLPAQIVETGLTQKSLRVWMRETPGHRAFTVVDHPVSRLYEVFTRLVRPEDPAEHAETRHVLQRHYGVVLPGASDDAAALRASFLSFVRFVQGNLGGQTGLKVDQAWASQVALLSGLCRFRVPDFVLRRSDLETALARILGRDDPLTVPPPPRAGSVIPLDQIHDAEVEAAVHDAYRRDYVFLGFGTWR